MVHAKSRVVLHVHTPFRWGDRANKNLVARACFVTSANLRHAWKEGTKYSQEVEKLYLVPMAKVLQKGWHKLTVGETQWQWKVHGNMPAKEDASDWKTKARYNDVRKLIELGERLEPKHHVETVSITDTRRRSSTSAPAALSDAARCSVCAADRRALPTFERVHTFRAYLSSPTRTRL
mmetsp:Transcript_45822/g.110277  ORF Transcript_45822/g.110277 Transcript_45822/m.110277 type:complete len:178 (+) Transcript_45822:278-811(+)